MNAARIFGILVFLVILIILLITPACKEQTIWTENYGERQIVCVKIPNANESPVKFEFNDGKNLSAVYWQRDSRFGYLYDFRADKIFIDAPSGYFMKTPNDFLESLERNIDCEKIKQSLLNASAD